MLADPKHGRWSYRIRPGFKVDPKTGKRRQVNGKTYATKREAQTERNKAAVLLDKGKVPTVDRTTYADYLPRWLERRTDELRPPRPAPRATWRTTRGTSSRTSPPRRSAACRCGRSAVATSRRSSTSSSTPAAALSPCGGSSPSSRARSGPR